VKALGERDKYDVFVATRRINSSSEPEWIRLNASLADARSALRRVCEAGGNGLVVPSRYGSANVNKAGARALAVEALGSLRERAPDSYSDLDEGNDEGACWLFQAENFTAQEQGVIPGVRSFRIDKLDGHVWSETETVAFLALSST
jgi:hypothetical protein